MVEVAGALDWGSFFIGVVFSAGVAIFFDLIRTKRNLRDSKLQVDDLQKKLRNTKDKSKSKKKKHDD